MRTLSHESNSKSSFASLSPNPRQISHLGCINMPELHTSSHAGGLAGYRAALWHQSGMMAASFVMLTGIASSLIQMLSFSFSLPLHPSLLFSLLMGHVNPYLGSLKKRESEREREWELPVPRTVDRWASLLGVSVALAVPSCFHAQPSAFHIQMLQSGLWPAGGFLQPGPWVSGSRWWFNSQGDGRKKEKGWFSDWMSHKKAFFLSCLGLRQFGTFLSSPDLGTCLCR